jgi:hypothetical protein
MKKIVLVFLVLLLAFGVAMGQPKAEKQSAKKVEDSLWVTYKSFSRSQISSDEVSKVLDYGKRTIDSLVGVLTVVNQQTMSSKPNSTWYVRKGQLERILGPITAAYNALAVEYNYSRHGGKQYPTYYTRNYK